MMGSWSHYPIMVKVVGQRSRSHVYIMHQLHTRRLHDQDTPTSAAQIGAMPTPVA